MYKNEFKSGPLNPKRDQNPPPLAMGIGLSVLSQDYTKDLTKNGKKYKTKWQKANK